MKINFVSFSDYNSELEVYDLKKMDLFVYLLVEIIKKGSNKTIKEVLLDLDITGSLLYLYQNNFYYLLDNKLIINNSNSEDISEVIVDDIKLSEFGNYCLSIGSIPVLNEIREKRVIYNPLSKELVSDNNVNESSNVVVIPNTINYLSLINEKKKEIMSKYSDDFVLNYKKVEANSYYFSGDKISSKIKDYLLLNKSEVSDDKVIDEKKSEFLSSNFKIKLFYGSNRCLVNSDYYLIVDKDNEFKVSDNKIYISEIVSEYNSYSFCSLDSKVYGYKVGNVKIDDSEYIAFEKELLKDHLGDIKKYLVRNKDKFNDKRIVEKVIDLL